MGWEKKGEGRGCCKMHSIMVAGEDVLASVRGNGAGIESKK